MKHMIHGVATATAISISGLLASSAPAQAYQVDCAILLCLAGGWPASAPCAHARAVFIRRITPWPIEPPLQILRCPMGVSFSPVESPGPAERMFDAAFQATLPRQSFPNDGQVIEVQITDGADIDISDDAFDFVRSIRVYHVNFSQRENDQGDCTRFDTTRLGTYGTQGEFSWSHSNIGDVPTASDRPEPTFCPPINYQSVFVEWRDQSGKYGFDEVHY